MNSKIIKTIVLTIIMIIQCNAQPKRRTDINIGFKTGEAGIEIAQFIKENLSKKIPEMVFYAESGRLANSITIYNVISEENQNTISKSLELEQKQKKWQMTYVWFMRSEIWIKHPNNSSSKRGDEEVLAVKILNPVQPEK